MQSSTAPLLWAACTILVIAGAAVQVAVGAGLSVVCGFLLILWLGTAAGVSTLLCLNFVVSVVATGCGGTRLRWRDVFLVSGATLAGCAAASVLPSLPEGLLKGTTACVLIVIALPRPPLPGAPPSHAAANAGLALAGLVTGMLTVWTAVPGPITPVVMARAGRSGAEIRRTMQPVSVVGYGAALAWGGATSVGTVGRAILVGLIAATLLGTGLGFLLRPRLDPAHVVLVIRSVAGVAALVLVFSLFG